MPVQLTGTAAKLSTSERRQELLESLGVSPFLSSLVTMMLPDPENPYAFGKINAMGEMKEYIPAAQRHLNEIFQRYLGTGWGTKIMEVLDKHPRTINIEAGWPSGMKPAGGVTSLPFNKRAPIDVFVNPELEDKVPTLSHELVHALQELSGMWGKTEGVSPTFGGKVSMMLSGYPRKDWADEALPYLVSDRYSKVTDPTLLYQTLRRMVGE